MQPHHNQHNTTDISSIITATTAANLLLNHHVLPSRDVKSSDGYCGCNGITHTDDAQGDCSGKCITTTLSPAAHDVYTDAAIVAAAAARALVCAAAAVSPDQTVTFDARISYDEDAGDAVQADDFVTI